MRVCIGAVELIWRLTDGTYEHLIKNVQDLHWTRDSRVSTWGLTVYIIANDPNCLSVQGLLCDNERRITKTRKTGPIRKWDNQVMRARRSRIKSLSPQHYSLFLWYFVSAITADGKWLAENDNVNSNKILQLWTGEDKTRRDQSVECL